MVVDVRCGVHHLHLAADEALDLTVTYAPELGTGDPGDGPVAGENDIGEVQAVAVHRGHLLPGAEVDHGEIRLAAPVELAARTPLDAGDERRGEPHAVDRIEIDGIDVEA